MKKSASALALGATLVLAGGAWASECPLLVKQLEDAVATVADKAKADEVKKLTAEAKKLHETGKHADSVKKADEAAKVAGIQLKHK